MSWAGPLFDGHVCSLGYAVADWIEAYCCHGEGDLQGQPAQVDAEMLDHIVECYRIDPVTGRRLFNEAVLSRPKGRAKSEIAAWVALAEAFADCVRFSHWDEDGQPVGRGGVTADQVPGDRRGPGRQHVQDDRVHRVGVGQGAPPGRVRGGDGRRQYQSATAIYLPHGGEIRACTAGSASKDGGLESHVVVDETHLFVLGRAAEHVRDDLPEPGQAVRRRPVAASDVDGLQAGRAVGVRADADAVAQGRAARVGVREPPRGQGPGRPQRQGHTIRQLRYVYGVASGWIDLDRKYRDMRDPRICRDDAEAARYFLNRPMSGNDAWIAKDVVERQIRPRGDWSRTRARG
jgi:hypothetical protein